MRLRVGIRPVERQNRGRNHLRLITSRVDRVFARPQRLLPEAAVAWAHQRTKFEFRAAGVLCRQTDVGLDHRDLSLPHDQHRHEIHLDQKWIEIVCAVEQRIVLQADSSAVVEKGLKVLVIVVQMVLAAENRFDEFGVARLRLFEVGDVLEFAQARGDLARGQRVAFEGRHDADYIDDRLAVVAAPRCDPQDAELLRAQPEMAFGALHILRYWHAVAPLLGNHQERHRMNWQQGTRRQDRALNTLLPAILNEAANIGEIAELLAIGRRFRAHRKRPANLRDYDTDFAGRNLNPRMLIEAIPEP